MYGEGKYTTFMGQSECAKCPAGSYNPDSGQASRGSCLLCPANTYSSGTGATAKSACKACRKGTFSAVGSTKPSDCVQRSTCSKGSEYSHVTGKCEKCPSGTYNPEFGSRCADCLADTYNDAEG